MPSLRRQTAAPVPAPLPPSHGAPPSAAESNAAKLEALQPDLNEGVHWSTAPTLAAVRKGAHLQLGHEGDAVGEVQRLIGTVAVTRRFGRTTLAAVERFQEARGLRPPAGQAGQVGPTTLAALEGGSSGEVQAEAYAAWTTGAGGSRELASGGTFNSRDFLQHHADRTSSDSADRVRAGTKTPYESVDAWDFTFEKKGRDGHGVEGTAFGLPLRVPEDAKVLDIQRTNSGSGGYGKFILLELVESKERLEIHHLSAVGDFSIGQVLAGGTVFGAQGGSGSSSNQDYATHVDVVGTAPAVEKLVRANATGKFKTRTAGKQGADKGGSTGGAGPDRSGGIRWTDAPTWADVQSGKATMHLGHRGPAVKELQGLLAVGTDGDFGPATEAAVKAFQRAAGLVPPAGQEGWVGRTTAEALRRQGQVGQAGAYGVAGLAIDNTPDVARWSPEIRALLRAISYTEGAEDAAGYRREVGGKEYGADTRVHPGAEDTQRYAKTGYNSDAFGRYQMLSTTWAAWAGAAGVPTAKQGRNSAGERYYDISPRFQDQAVLTYLRAQGVEAHLRAGDVEGAIAIPSVASQWASLPTFPDTRQHNGRTREFYKVYEKMLAEEKATDRARAKG